MLIKNKSTLTEAQVTDQSAYLNRRDFIKGSAAGLAAVGLGISGTAFAASENASRIAWRKTMQPLLDAKTTGPYQTSEEMTPLKDVLRYNNFYEFGTDKGDPAEEAHRLTIAPWKVRVEGEVEKPADYLLEDLVSPYQLQERIYRLRCVEAWSMVIPWLGIPLADWIKRFQPTSKAKYVYFETLVRPEEMVGQKSAFSSIFWPYREGLRLDEAMHPLTFMAVGLYGDILPNQNGAPLRLVVPWKYGFKSIKSIVKISFTEEEPETTWSQIAPREYGFYANVNPQVDHPRWSQKSERRLPGGIFGAKRIETRMFNGYAEEVASLYSGMDLSRFY